MTSLPKILLSPPDVSEADSQALQRAMAGGWIAPLGPEVDAFEAELAARCSRSDAAALSSGTAALHVALLLAGVGPGDTVAVSTLTFAASVNPIRYVGAEPLLIDSHADSWNLDPNLLAEALDQRTVKAVIAVDLYGQCADYAQLTPLCEHNAATLIEDAAEALGATYEDRPAGSFGKMSVLSFNGNKIITTSGGGALLADDPELITTARFLASQARDDAPHYEHSRLGYNYRLSNILAALGTSQLADLDRRVETRRDHNRIYRTALGRLPGFSFMEEAPGCRSTFWLTALTVDESQAGISRDALARSLSENGIEARPVWKPMHLQPLYRDVEVIGGSVSERLFRDGLCLPSGSSLSVSDRQRVIDVIIDSCPHSIQVQS